MAFVGYFLLYSNRPEENGSVVEVVEESEPETGSELQQISEPFNKTVSGLPEFSTRKPKASNLDNRIVRYNDGSVDLVASIEKSRLLNQSPTIKRDLDLLNEIFSSYQTIYQENPVGSENAEITAQLLGANPKKVVFIDPNSSSISNDGELLDRWGNPFRFHPMSASYMGVRSLGPDGILWTDDDVAYSSESLEEELKLNFKSFE